MTTNEIILVSVVGGVALVSGVVWLVRYAMRGVMKDIRAEAKARIDETEAVKAKWKEESLALERDHANKVADNALSRRIKEEDALQEKEQAARHRAKAKTPCTIQIAVLDMTLINMTDDERVAHLNKIGEEQNKIDWRLEALKPQPNPFPVWVQDILRALAKKYEGSITYDTPNRVYAIYVMGDQEHISVILNELDKEIIAAVETGTEEMRNWKGNHQMRASALMADEHKAMDELRETLGPGVGAGGGGGGGGMGRGF